MDPRAPPNESESRMTLTTRKPTGEPAWPIILLAGQHDTGKTYTAIEASASPLVSTTYYVGYGEVDPDEYAIIPGADFEVVQHNGTVPGIIAVLNEIADLQEPFAAPNLIVLDSGSRYWDALTETVQRAKLARGPRGADENDKDLWDAAKADWQAMLGALRRHHGPSIITARFEEAAVYVGGKITAEKAWRIRAEKGLAYDVQAVVEMPERGSYALTGVTSGRMKFAGRREWPEFTIEALWREMGLAGNVGRSHYVEPITTADANDDQSGRDWATELAGLTTADQVAKLGAEASAAKVSTAIRATIRKKHAALAAAK